MPISKIASRMNIQPVSVNQMMHQLEACGLVVYEPYKGVHLTEEGQVYANKVLRRRRLWECFLVERLGVPPVEADALACNLEHTIPIRTADLLADYLGHPNISPQGKAIPKSETELDPTRGISLSSLPLDVPAEVVRMEVDREERTFLEQSGLLTGKELRVMGIGQSGIALIQMENQLTLRLAKKLMDSIWVQPRE